MINSRLTYVTEDGEILFHPEDLPEDEGMTVKELAENRRWKTLDQIVEKLTNMEQMEEQGLLVRLPYNNGALYSVNYSNKTIAENTIIEIAINGHSKRFSCLDDNLRERKFYDYMIGENVFLTREEAEEKLEEMKK